MSVFEIRNTNRAFRPRFRPRLSRCCPRIEGLESRQLLATISVNAAQVVRGLNTQLLGVNVAWYDSVLNTPQTQQMVEAAGLTMFRFPGGSSSDDFHFNAAPTYNGEGTDGSMASFIASVNGVGMATIDYGSGSPQEGAAFLAYLEAPVGNTTVIGSGPEWNDSTNSWQTVNWQTAGYWASLRAQAPLAKDDGLNFLRLDHPAPFNVPYWEVGNEEYGSWEIDHHTVQHDPATYITFAKQFENLAATIDPSISVGLDVQSPGIDFNNWIANILQQSKSQGLTIGFLSDHNYVQAPGSESDSNLLLNTATGANSDPSDPGNPYNWAVRAADYETDLTTYLGSSVASKVQLFTTEFNSVYSGPGKQTTSLVNGLFLADSLGALLETPYNGADVWDLRNSYSTGGNDPSSLYGWRQGGDYGLIGSPGGTAPATGSYVPYPTYFAEELASKIIQAGGNVVQASTSDPNLTTYAVLEPNGHLDLLVINKSASSALSGAFQLANFNPAAQATVWQYGEAQDTAQSQSTTGASALANFTANLAVSGSTFNYSFPAYSMTVLDLGRASSGTAGPTITKVAAAAPSPVTGTTTVLSVTATDPSGNSALTYTWAAMGTPPAPITYSAIGTNAAQSVTATFSKAGSYTFQVTVSDRGGYIATSSVTVAVNQSLTAIKVSPATLTLAAKGQQQFSATANDQFGNPMATQPALAWSVASGGGTIASSGLYTAPNAAGSATVKATSGAVSGTAGVTVLAPPTTSTSVAYSLVNSWSTGFQSSITITNTGTTTLTNWTLSFNFAATITQIWDATVASHSGSFYVIQNAGYNSTIEPGQSVSFGFLGSSGGAPVAPSNFLVNGAASGGTGSPPPSSGALSATVAFADVNDWGTGFTGSLTLTNTGSSPISGWMLSFDFVGSISSFWNASITSHAGNQYVIENASYNSVIGPGQSVTIGFNASPGHPSSGPTNYKLNGVAIS